MVHIDLRAAIHTEPCAAIHTGTRDSLSRIHSVCQHRPGRAILYLVPKTNKLSYSTLSLRTVIRSAALDLRPELAIRYLHRPTGNLAFYGYKCFWITIASRSYSNEIRYELNGVEVDRSRNPGITTALKHYVSLSIDRSKALMNAGWDHTIAHDKDNFSSTSFYFCVPMNTLLGFCEDYRRIVMNARHELILIRARLDTNAMYAASLSPAIIPKLEIRKIQWRIPHVALEDTQKLSMLRLLQSDRPIAMSFRSWELHEYPLLQTTMKHTWTVKASSQIEKPRYAFFGMQIDRKNNLKKNASRFDACKLTNVRLFLNSETYPYDDLNLDFDKSKYALLYDMYAKFSRSYYGHGEPLICIYR